MSRRRNLNEPGHAHELTFSCYRGFPFLAAERTCAWLSEAIAAARRELEFDLWAYVFMPEHVHLILFPRRQVYDMAEIRQAIKEPVARLAVQSLEESDPEWIERITVRKGDRVRRCFWQQGGGYDRNIVEPKTLFRMIEYLHRNPVRRNLVERVRDWKWSSALWFEEMLASPVEVDRIPLGWSV